MDSTSTKPEEVAAYKRCEAKQARLQSMLSALLDDPILADVPRKSSFAEVDTLINLELGSAMRVTVVKLDNASFGSLRFIKTPVSIQSYVEKIRRPSISYGLGFETGYQEEDK